MLNTKLIVKLNELPDDGQDWVFTPNSQPNLNKQFEPDISTENYKVEVTIKPLGNVYEVKVNYELKFQATCSLCAFEFPLPSSKVVKELVMVNPKGQSRIDKQKVTSKNWSDELFCTEIDGNSFNLGEFIREVILVEMPVRPLGYGELCDKRQCEPLLNISSADKFSSANINEWTGKEKNKPFSALKNLIKVD